MRGAMSVKSILDWMFKLPPVEERMRIQADFPQRLYARVYKQPWPLPCRDDGTYTLCQLARWSFWAALLSQYLYIGMYVAGYGFDLKVVAPKLCNLDNTEVFFKGYAGQVVFPVSAVMASYFLATLFYDQKRQGFFLSCFLQRIHIERITNGRKIMIDRDHLISAALMVVIGFVTIYNFGILDQVCWAVPILIGVNIFGPYCFFLSLLASPFIAATLFCTVNLVIFHMLIVAVYAALRQRSPSL